jgi:hypothetical protein
VGEPVAVEPLFVVVGVAVEEQHMPLGHYWIVVFARSLEVAVGEWVYKLESLCCPVAEILLSAFSYKKSLSQDCFFSSAPPSPPTHPRPYPVRVNQRQYFAPGHWQVEDRTDLIVFAVIFGPAAVGRAAVEVGQAKAVDFVWYLDGRRQAVPPRSAYRCSLMQFKIFSR